MWSGTNGKDWSIIGFSSNGTEAQIVSRITGARTFVKLTDLRQQKRSGLKTLADAMSAFFAECFVPDEDAFVKMSEVKDLYKKMDNPKQLGTIPKSWF